MLYGEGASDREVMQELDLTPSRWKVLMDDINCDFPELVELGRARSQAWWERQGRVHLQNNKFNASLWTIQMKNRFGWSEKSEQSLTNVEFRNMDDASLDEQIAALDKALRTKRLHSVN
jgi:hypothetical protein